MASKVLTLWPRPLRGAALPILAMLLWMAAAQGAWTTSPLLVHPADVWARAVDLARSGELWAGLSASLSRDLIGFAIGASAGLLVGALLGLSRWADALLGPSLHTLKQISLFAWIPLLSVWFGLGDVAKVVFLSLAAFFPVVLNTYEGLRSVPLEFIEVARVLKFNRWQWVSKVLLPSAAPSIFTGIHQSLIYAWLATLGAEYLLVSGKGVGNLLIDGREHFQMDLVIVGMVIVGAVGFALNGAAGWLERRALAWRA